MKQITAFYLEGCLFGMDSMYVNAILPPKTTLKIPQEQEQLFLGVMQLVDGRLIHVINTRKLLGLSPSPSEDAKVLVLQCDTLSMGLVADGPPRVLEIDESTIARHLPISQINTEYFAGTVNDKDGKVVLLLNMPLLLSVLNPS